MEDDIVYNVEVSNSEGLLFGYYVGNTALVSSDAEERLQALKHLEAAADYLRKTLSPSTEWHE